MSSRRSPGAERPIPRGIPLAVKVAFTAWMAFWVPMVVWAVGPQNFFWLCNLAKFLTLYALWAEDRLILSSQVGLVLVVGVGWILDLSTAGFLDGTLAGFTEYMFEPELPLVMRLASLYHVWLPLLLLWLVRRTGYDRRGPWLQGGIGTLGVMGGWLFAAPRYNVNWVHRPFGMEQAWMAEPVFVILVSVAYALLFYLPGHLLVIFLLERLESV